LVANQDPTVYSLIQTYSNQNRQEELMAAMQQLAKPEPDKYE
jgi:hypothetical protein